MIITAILAAALVASLLHIADLNHKIKNMQAYIDATVFEAQISKENNHGT